MTVTFEHAVAVETKMAKIIDDYVQTESRKSKASERRVFQIPESRTDHIDDDDEDDLSESEENSDLLISYDGDGCDEPSTMSSLSSLCCGNPRTQTLI